MNREFSSFHTETSHVPAPQKASVAIYEQIRSKILSGELKPGDKLPAERDLIDMFQRSRPTVREALRMLENKNYITISRGKGSIVNKLSTDEIEKTLSNLVQLNLVTPQNIIDIRDVCESIAITLAAQNRTEKDILVMQEILDTAQTVKHNFAEFMNYGLKFNGAIARSSHNEMLYLIVQITSSFSHDKMNEYAEKLSSDEKDDLTKWISEQHQDMLNAIINKDAVLASELNRLHIQKVGESIFGN